MIMPGASLMAEEDDRCAAELASLFRATRELMDGTAGPIERLIEQGDVVYGVWLDKTKPAGIDFESAERHRSLRNAPGERRSQNCGPMRVSRAGNHDQNDVLQSLKPVDLNRHPVPRIPTYRFSPPYAQWSVTALLLTSRAVFFTGPNWQVGDVLCGTKTLAIPRLSRRFRHGALIALDRCNSFDERHDLADYPMCIPSSAESVASGTSKKLTH
jgi:hypothetical protein